MTTIIHFWKQNKSQEISTEVLWTLSYGLITISLRQDWVHIKENITRRAKDRVVKEKKVRFVQWVDYRWASLAALLVKNPPARQETLARFLGWEDPGRRDKLPTPVFLDFLGGSDGKESTCQTVKNLPAMRETWLQVLGWENSGRRAWQPTPVSCLENPHGQKNLAGYSPWRRKELDATVRLSRVQQTAGERQGLGSRGVEPARRPILTGTPGPAGLARAQSCLIFH